jgi:hypothetical protein
MSVSNKPVVSFPGTDELKCFLSFREQGMQKITGDVLIMMVWDTVGIAQNDNLSITHITNILF